MKYILSGTLIFIIAVSLLSVFLNLNKPKRSSEPREIRAFCLETKQEFVVDTKKMNPLGEGGIPMHPFGLIVSPFTNKPTAVPMTQCPKCKKWFVPEHMKNALERKDQSPMMMMMMMQPPGSKMVCPHCEVDIMQWYRENRKHRKK